MFRLTGSFLTGERVVCTLIYDNSDFTQMLQVRSLIDSFTGDHGFLSNSWPSVVVFEGREFPLVEHAYQAAKTTDDRARAEIAALATPAAAKQAGSALPRRSGWNTVQRLLVMHELLNAKFGIQSLRELLLATGDAELVAVNDSGDRFWGVFDHLGENRLGELLMEVRTPRRRAH